MRKQTNRCTCAKQELFNVNDIYNSIACKKCFEIVSYEQLPRIKMIKNNILIIANNLIRHKTSGLFFRNACVCNQKKEKQLNDVYKTTFCENCFEIISYFRVATKNEITKMQPTMFDFSNVLNIVRPDK